MTTIDIHGGLDGRTILLTGFTGFMGKVLTEKLLRSCPEVKQIYLLVREKKGKGILERVDQIFQDPLFSLLNQDGKKFRNKVVLVPGDCSQPGLGLSPDDTQRVIEEVNIIIHGAATVRFDENLKSAYKINVLGTKQLLTLATMVKSLKVFVHISTAYANCHLQKIEEKIYEPPMDLEKLSDIVNNLDDEVMHSILPQILGKWPNTYSFTKAMAEHVVKEFEGRLPIVVFRPAVVVGTAKEPLIGWTDNLYGPTGLVIGAGCGVLRSIYCDLECIANIVPVDMAVSALISSAVKRIQNPPRDNSIPVYNYVSSLDNPLKWREFKRLIELHGQEVPPVKAIWCYSLTTHRIKLFHRICVLFLHYLPALILDTLGSLTKSENPNLYKIYTKIDHYSEVLEYFANRSWEFTNDNVKQLWQETSQRDKKEFAFDISTLDWDRFFYDYIRGLRVYLLKDGLETLPEAKLRWKRFQYAHKAIKITSSFILIYFAWLIVSSIF